MVVSLMSTEPSPAAGLPSSKTGVSSSRLILSATTLEEGIDPPASIKVKEEVRQTGRVRKRPCKANASDGASMSMKFKLFPNDVPRTFLDPVLLDLGASRPEPPLFPPDHGEENHDGHTSPTLLVGQPPEDSMSYRPHKAA